MRNLKKRLRVIEKIIKESTVDTDEMTEFLKEILPENKKSLAELFAELDTETLRAIVDSDEPEKVLVAAVRGKKD